MTVRDSDVKAIIDTERDTTPFINTALLIVTEELTGTGQSSGRLDLITTYLAAHFCAITEMQGGLVRKKMGDTEEDYIPISSYREPLQGFRMTRYGQQAMVLDSSGNLAALSGSAGLKAQFGLFGQKDDEDWTGLPEPD